ncbi:vicilin Cor a 11.0101-like [Typha angustifolia]|uniref:vicilin Cor a 11.0101-like n=1 Tax=Typha angustifolia TaxID=59011 RepID=UPI003C2E65D2
MATNRILPLLLFLSILLLSTTLGFSYERDDPELRRCKEKCRAQPHYDQGMRRKCEERCERQQEETSYGRKKDNPREDPEQRLQQCRQRCEQSRHGSQERMQCQRRCQEEYEQQRERGSRGMEDREDPQTKLRECRQKCQQQHGEEQDQRRCEQWCEERYRERRGSSRDNPHREEEEERSTEENPYMFDRQSFRHQFRSEHGHLRILRNFAEKSPLLIGIANYRLAILEANPRTFVMPSHWDADTVLYVVRGRGIMSILHKDDKESHEIREGDIMMIPSGLVVYLVNSDSREKLVMAKLLRPVSTPGRFEHFFGAGGQNPESFYRTFSKEVMQAAFKSPSERLERIFEKQSKGIIIRASEEQIRALSRHASHGGGRWPFGRESRGPYNLLRKQAAHSNRHGEIYEADANDYQQLRDMDVKVSFVNISAGSMMAPFYNSRATKILLVTEGNGHIEIVCPHLAGRQGRTRKGGQREEEQEGGQQGQRYQLVQGRVSTGSVVVVPPGHPTVDVASRDQNFQAVCFEIRAENNERIFLAGRNNVLKKMDKEAKELSFASEAREVDELFNSQEEEVFFEGPEGREQQRGKGRRQFALASVLEAVAAF